MLTCKLLTGSASVDVILGQPVGLPKRQLPTKLDVLNAYLLKLNLSAQSEIYSELVEEIANIWKVASLPTTSKKLMLKNVQYFIEK